MNIITSSEIVPIIGQSVSVSMAVCTTYLEIQ